MYNNKFLVVFEGVDGTGKTTQCIELCNYLNYKGLKARYVKGAIINDLMKKMYIEVKKQCEDPNIIDMYGLISLAYETNKNRFESLICDANFEVIIFDRCIYTDRITLRRTGKVSNKIIDFLVNWLPEPDIIFYLEIDCELAAKRIVSRGMQQKPRGFETKEELINFALEFEEEFDNPPNNLFRINAAENINSIHQSICRILDSFMLNTDLLSSVAAKSG